jgi:hypothetical protein
VADGSDACAALPNPNARDSNAAPLPLVENKDANGTAAAQLAPKPQKGEPVLPPPPQLTDLRLESFALNEAKVLHESRRWIGLAEQ